MKNYSVSVSNNCFTYLGNVRRQGGPHLTRNANMNLCYPSNGIITMTRGVPKWWYIGIIPSQNCPLFSCSMFKIPSRWWKFFKNLMGVKFLTYTVYNNVQFVHAPPCFRPVNFFLSIITCTWYERLKFIHFQNEILGTPLTMTLTNL